MEKPTPKSRVELTREATRRPLAIPQLRGIGRRRRDDPDVQALLWEIRRLHELLLTSVRMLGQLEVSVRDPELGKQAYAVIKALKAEPGVIAAASPPAPRQRRRPYHERPYEYEASYEKRDASELEEARRLHPGLSDAAALKRLARAKRG